MGLASKVPSQMNSPLHTVPQDTLKGLGAGTFRAGAGPDSALVELVRMIF